MSLFSFVDDAPDPRALVAFLDEAADAESGMKHDALVAHVARAPSDPILDVGCGAGHDAVLFARHGLRVIGVDPSAVMIAASQARSAGVRGLALVRANAAGLPFHDETFAGCRVERVLMHVEDPGAALREIVRCLRPGGLLTAFEPDWSSFTVVSDVMDDGAGWISSARHPDAGARLWELVEAAGCTVLDRVEELSVRRSLATLERVAGFPLSVERAVAAGRVDREAAREWVVEQRERDAAGRFEARIRKIHVTATKRGATAA